MAKYKFIKGVLTLVEGEEPSSKEIGFGAVHTFHEGMYENISEDPIHITSMAQLKEECHKNGVTSKYERDTTTRYDRGIHRWI